MEHATPRRTDGDTGAMKEGDRFSCSNCGCRIVLQEHGDPSKMKDMRPFTCCCGSVMRRETQP
jgi:hypothetical protein